MKKIILLGSINVNCFFIEHNKECYIVDPGYQKERIIQCVEKYNWKVKGILLTHGHADHIGAIDCFDVPIYIHKKEYNNFLNAYNNCFDKKPYLIENLNIIKITEKDYFELSEKIITVIHTPGHTIGSVCFKFENELYTGDTLFQGTVGLWFSPTGNIIDIQNSILKLIERQDKNTRVYPAHGQSTTIKDEEKSNPFYNEWKL